MMKQNTHCVLILNCMYVYCVVHYNRMLIKDTEKANLSYLLATDTIMITSPDIQLKEAWALLRKTPELVPLGIHKIVLQ